jgi:mono/diheme cytochrome c family protein
MSVGSVQLACLFAVLLCGAAVAETPTAGQGDSFEQAVVPFLKQHCTRCHGPEEQEADFAVHGLTAELIGDNLSKYEKVLEMVSIGDMPPEDEPQPTRAERDRFVGWVSGQLKALGRGPSEDDLAFPHFANRVNNEDLFSGKYKGPAYTDSRVWRINAHIYKQLVAEMELKRDFVPPLQKLDGEGFDDYALLYADEATIRTMIQNGKKIAMNLVHGRLYTPAGAGERNPNNKAHRKPSRHKVLAKFADLQESPTRAQMDDAVRFTFGLLLRRTPTDAELDRCVTKNLEPNVKSGGADAGLRGFLVSMLLSPEFLFRMELGLGPQQPDGRRMLSPHELAYALSYTLHDHPVKSLLTAADQGNLATRDDVEREARALLDSDELLRGRARRGELFWTVANGPPGGPAKPRMLRFFREYFDYAKAGDVFKDDTRSGGVHDARKIVQDADWLVLSVLAEDRDVLAQLLTTENFPVMYGNAKLASKVNYATVYNFTEPNWPTDRAVTMPTGQRAGLLTHPAWLVAHSGNFDNDPVRRGKWIQEHLLAGVVPDLPIGVEAQLPDAPHKTLRQRFEVVKETYCWRCHKKMNPLGEPFEIYDDFGRFRQKHHVAEDGRVLASDLEINRNQRGLTAKPLHPVDSTGRLSGTGDPQLDGEVTDAIDLVHRLAKSERVRQSFIRHVFRYWMGRNETLDDSPTLMAMDDAYVSSRGSFKETLVALFTSDSFLYRK